MNPMIKAALSSLYQELGLKLMLITIIKLSWSKLKGEPFQDLPLAQNRKERLSREQLGPVIIIYRILLMYLNPQEALKITTKVVETSGRAFLKVVLKDLDLNELTQLSEKEQKNYLTNLLDAVPNSIFTIHIVDQSTVHFTVTDCLFVQLCHQLELPQLAPLFCAVDKAFFQKDVTNISFERETTIAEGGHTCPFVFKVESDH